MTTPPRRQTGAPAANWRRRLILLALLAALGGGAWFGWRGLQDWAQREELQAELRLPFSDAEPRLKRLAERRPHDAAVARALALGYLEAHRLFEAEPYFARWCALRPADAEPFRHRAGLWKTWSRREEAVADAERALRLEPNDPELRQQRAVWLFGLCRYEEAERECRRCLEEEPGHAGMLQLQAALAHRQGRMAEAAAAVDRVLRDNPAYADALVLRGVLHLEADRAAEAIPFFRRATALEGLHRPAALYELSLALARTGQAEESKKAMAESRLLQEVKMYSGLPTRDSVDLELRFAELLLDAGRLQDALGMLTRLEKQHPRHAAVHRLLASYYEQQGQPQLAAEHRSRSAEGQNPKDKGQNKNP
jgi:tetratricopeptide (TPR) repeat protein